ncbi:DUF3237 family protein [Runella sp. CRIBMP]|uniref:DUF3237 domain-containing protein n=1 Tax=Runella sp. CRIBMP TaxID=2683261 RepID=UPI0014126552|nr:DUF3237 domain-containing protein [Runella sp. CRIBMP]NBB19240.1 DUF3237 family protein [Runella sp. CRIBMP]
METSSITPVRALSTEFLMEMRCELTIQIIGDTPNGHRRIYHITGGTVKGPKIRGDVLPGGSDSFLLRLDGTGLLDVRVTVKTDDDALIYVNYWGILHHTPILEGRLMAGETVRWDEYYFRTAPFFETASEKYDYLNHTMAIGVGEADFAGVSYSVYRVL